MSGTICPSPNMIRTSIFVVLALSSYAVNAVGESHPPDPPTLAARKIPNFLYRILVMFITCNCAHPYLFVFPIFGQLNISFKQLAGVPFFFLLLLVLFSRLFSSMTRGSGDDAGGEDAERKKEASSRLLRACKRGW